MTKLHNLNTNLRVLKLERAEIQVHQNPGNTIKVNMF